MQSNTVSVESATQIVPLVRWLRASWSFYESLHTRTALQMGLPWLVISILIHASAYVSLGALAISFCLGLVVSAWLFAQGIAQIQVALENLGTHEEIKQAKFFKVLVRSNTQAVIGSIFLLVMLGVCMCLVALPFLPSQSVLVFNTLPWSGTETMVKTLLTFVSLWGTAPVIVMSVVGLILASAWLIRVPSIINSKIMFDWLWPDRTRVHTGWFVLWVVCLAMMWLISLLVPPLALLVGPLLVSTCYFSYRHQNLV